MRLSIEIVYFPMGISSLTDKKHLYTHTHTYIHKYIYLKQSTDSNNNSVFLDYQSMLNIFTVIIFISIFFKLLFLKLYLEFLNYNSNIKFLTNLLF